MGRFAPEATPSPTSFDSDFDDNGGDDGDAFEDDDDGYASSTDEMST